MKSNGFNRRSFLRQCMVLAAGAPILVRYQSSSFAAEKNATASQTAGPKRSDSKVAIVRCRSYGPEVRTAMAKSFDLLGGIGSLVKNKTVTIKLNLTGTDFSSYMQRPVGETYMTHYATAATLAGLLFDAGARRVRFVESTQSKSSLETTLGFADWDVKALAALGKVEFENTRNLGKSKGYAHFKVPNGGYMFSSLDLNQAYEDTDV